MRQKGWERGEKGILDSKKYKITRLTTFLKEELSSPPIGTSG